MYDAVNYTPVRGDVYGKPSRPERGRVGVEIERRVVLGRRVKSTVRRKRFFLEKKPQNIRTWWFFFFK